MAGKGGVGKTTVTAVLARAAADAGQRVLAIELDGKPVLPELLGELPCQAISASKALEEYLRDHGFGRVAKRLSTSGVIDVVATAAPGIHDIVVLGKIKQLERSGEWDVIVVDGPAAGHAVTFLTSAAGLHDAVRSGPVRIQADEVLELLRDPTRAQVVLVTLPETTPVNEVIETAYALEDRVGVRLGPLVVNGVDRRPARVPRSRTGSRTRRPTDYWPRQQGSAGLGSSCRRRRSSGCAARCRSSSGIFRCCRLQGWPPRKSPSWQRRCGAAST